MIDADPLISILTPSFNQARWIGDCLRSVQTQTYRSIEHIVMDGGSTDGTLQILQTAGPNVYWSSERDQGQSHALNKAFQRSKGEVIGWINSDDAYVDRRAVAEAVKVFKAHPDVGAIYGHGIVVDENNRFMHALWSPEYSDRLLNLGALFLQPSVFLRRSVLPTPLVREDLHYVMDWALFLQLRSQGVRFRRIPVTVAIDRQQSLRKTLQFGSMEQEIGRVIAEQGSSYGPLVRFERKTASVAKRLVGIQLAATSPSRIQPAIDVDFLTSRRRIFNQGLLPRSFISSG